MITKKWVLMLPGSFFLYGDDIADICDETGYIFGLMPHPECFAHEY